MADIDIRRAHNKTPEEARKIAQEVADRLSGKFDTEVRWQGNDLVFERMGLSGKLAVMADEVHIQANLGLLLKPLKGRIVAEVERFLDESLAEPRVG